MNEKIIIELLFPLCDIYVKVHNMLQCYVRHSMLHTYVRFPHCFDSEFSP